MTDELMDIPSDDKQNYSFCRLQLVVKLVVDTQLNEPTNQKSTKVSKVVKPTHKKTLRTSIINCRMSPPYLVKNGREKL